MARNIVESGTPASVAATATAATVVVAAPGAGKSLLIKSFQITVGANITNQLVSLRPDSNGTAYFSWPCGAAAGASTSIIHTLGDPWRLDTNTSLCVHLATASTAGVYVTATYEVEQR